MPHAQITSLTQATPSSSPQDDIARPDVGPLGDPMEEYDRYLLEDSLQTGEARAAAAGADSEAGRNSARAFLGSGVLVSGALLLLLIAAMTGRVAEVERTASLAAPASTVPKSVGPLPEAQVTDLWGFFP